MNTIDVLITELAYFKEFSADNLKKFIGLSRTHFVSTLRGLNQNWSVTYSINSNRIIATNPKSSNKVYITYDSDDLITDIFFQ